MPRRIEESNARAAGSGAKSEGVGIPSSTPVKQLEVVEVVPPQQAPLQVDRHKVPDKAEKCVLNNKEFSSGLITDAKHKGAAASSQVEEAEKTQPAMSAGKKAPNVKSSADYKISTYQPVSFRHSGTYPCLAVNNQHQAVVVYHHNNIINEMYYCVGKMNPRDGNIKWEDEHLYDTGAYPKIAINNAGLVVEVHESPRKRKTWYHVGKVTGNTIQWGPSYELGQGRHPDVTLSDNNQLVIVEESGGYLFSPEGYYFFGEVVESTKTIQFSRKREMLVHSAKEPSVTMKGKNIVVAFHHEGKYGKLHVMLGRIEGLIVQWAEYEFAPFAEGIWPSVSMNEDGVVVVSCQGCSGGQLLCREGQLKETDGTWHLHWSRTKAKRYEYGAYPSICLLNDNQIIEMHGNGGALTGEMLYTLGHVKQ